jgi:hypothetical protein
MVMGEHGIESDGATHVVGFIVERTARHQHKCRAIETAVHSDELKSGFQVMFGNRTQKCCFGFIGHFFL